MAGGRLCINKSLAERHKTEAGRECCATGLVLHDPAVFGRICCADECMCLASEQLDFGSRA